MIQYVAKENNLNWKLNLNLPEHAYLFGFIQTDGSLQQNTYNRGKLTIELNIKDSDILYKFGKIIPFSYNISERIRDTNFKNNHHSIQLTVYHLNFRNELVKNGIPYGKKSEIIEPPINCSKQDYYRGIIDGDGSLGFTKKNVPFVSLVTSSEKLTIGYSKLIFDLTGKEKVLTRNKRDNIYNIVLYNEDAQKLVEYLYYENCLCLKRKYESVINILKWERPLNIKRVPHLKFWDEEQDQIVLTYPIEEAAKILHRSLASVKTRSWRLKCHLNIKQ